MSRLRYAFPVAFLAALALVLAGCGPNLFDRLQEPYALGCCGLLIVILSIIALIEVAQSNRSAGDKLIWFLIIILAPGLGVLIYYLFARK